MRRRPLAQPTPEQRVEQEAREREELRELEEAQAARERLRTLYEQEQGRHLSAETPSAAELVHEERGARGEDDC